MSTVLRFQQEYVSVCFSSEINATVRGIKVDSEIKLTYALIENNYKLKKLSIIYFKEILFQNTYVLMYNIYSCLDLNKT